MKEPGNIRSDMYKLFRRNIIFAIEHIVQNKVGFILKIIQLSTALWIFGLILNTYLLQAKSAALIKKISGGEETYAFVDCSTDDWYEEVSASSNVKGLLALIKMIDAVDAKKVLVNNGFPIDFNEFPDLSIDQYIVSSDFFERFGIDVGDYKNEIDEKFHFRIVKNNECVPILIGSNFQKSVKSGDILTNSLGQKFEVVGRLPRNTYCTIPTEDSEAYCIDEAIVAPPWFFEDEYLSDFLIAYIESMQFTTDKKTALSPIINYMNDHKFLNGYYVSYSQQLKYADQFFFYILMTYGIFGILLFVFTFISIFCMVSEMLNSYRKEYAINMMLGATYKDICVRFEIEIVFLFLICTIIGWICKTDAKSYAIATIGVVFCMSGLLYYVFVYSRRTFLENDIRENMMM